MRLTPSFWRILMPFLCLAIILALIFYIQPRAMSYRGLNLLFNLAVPIALATVAQMLIISVNDLDLSIGAYVSFIVCVTGTYLQTNPVIGGLIIFASIVTYALLGAIIYVRNLPAIVVTLGMSFVWSGLALWVLPSPGGQAPEWIRTVMTVKPPFMPMAIVASILIAVISHLIVKRSFFGVLMRGVGSNVHSMVRFGRPVVLIRSATYALAACYGVLAGICLIGLTTSADANIALRYTLLSIAGVILGGGEFTGGKVSAIGAVAGALTLTLTASLLSFLRLPPDWQIGAQGAILITVLAIRVIFNHFEQKKP